MGTAPGLHRAPRSRAVSGRKLRLLTAIVVAMITAVTLGGVATAYFTASSTGTGTITAGTLNPPTAVSGAQVSLTSTVAVSWAAPSGPNAPTGYYVRRTPSSGGPTAPACGTSAAAPTASTSCSDTSVAVGGYTYVVVALFHTWTATSAPSAEVDVVETNQTITFTQPASPVTATSSAALTFSSTSGLPVSVTPADATVCSVSGATVSYLKSGTCTLTATQAGDATYNAATPVVRVVTVDPAPQTLTFGQPSTPANAGTSTTLAATASSGLPVTFTTTSAASICTITGGTTLSFVGAGSCVVNADQGGDAVYAAAAQVQRTVVVNAADILAPTITNVEPGNESGLWSAIDCSTAGVAAGRICATVTDNVGVASVTMTLQRNSNSWCWNGVSSTSFANTGTCPQIPLSLSSGVWIQTAQLVRQTGGGNPNFANGSYTLVITAKDAAGNTTTATRTFTMTGA